MRSFALIVATVTVALVAFKADAQTCGTGAHFCFPTLITPTDVWPTEQDYKIIAKPVSNDTIDVTMPDCNSDFQYREYVVVDRGPGLVRILPDTGDTVNGTSSYTLSSILWRTGITCIFNATTGAGDWVITE
jgi:hypothetical protein